MSESPKPEDADAVLHAKPTTKTAARIELWSVPIGDIAGLANVVVAILAIAISLYVFRQQSMDSAEQSRTLTDSKVALLSVIAELRTEQRTLGSVVSGLKTVGDTLTELQAHSKTQVERLQAANRTLRSIVTTASEQYSVNRKTLAISEQQYRLLALQRAAEVARANAKPRLFFGAVYDAGDTHASGLFSSVGSHPPLTFVVGAETSIALGILIKNAGTAILRSPVIVINDSPSALTLAGRSPGDCFNLDSHTLQCSGRDLPPGQSYKTTFALNLGTISPSVSIPLHVEIVDSGSGLDFTDTLRLVLIRTKA